VPRLGSRLGWARPWYLYKLARAARFFSKISSGWARPKFWELCSFCMG